MKKEFAKVVIEEDGKFNYKRGGLGGINTFVCMSLFLISQARDRGCNFEDLADGYGEGLGTHGDWSGIRDSSEGAVRAMFERSLNFLFS